MFRFFHSVLRQNSYFITIFTIGFCFSIFLAPFMSQKACINYSLSSQVNNINGKRMPSAEKIDIYEPKINLAAKPKIALKVGHGVVRPRFHKAELGIRNKLFLAVLTSPESISTLAVALNKTASKYVNKVMFFIDAPSAQRLNVSLLKLPGIVGFTDTRRLLKPFHLIKYVSDNFLDDFDFFFIIKDTGYVRAQKLQEFAKKISINRDVHVGSILETSGSSEKICSLDSGILLSNSVVKKMQKSLEWCVKNFVSKDDSTNIGQCVNHATKVPCSETAQGSEFYTYRVETGLTSPRSLSPAALGDRHKFDRAIVIAPLSSPEQYYSIHFYFSAWRAVGVSEDVTELRRQVSSGKSTEGGQWPVASQPPSLPATHFDVPRWEHFTRTHKYLNTDFSNLVPLSGAEKEDIQRVVTQSISHVEDVSDGALKFYSFINGYQKFDASRGMDYIIDLAFRETTSGKTLHKRLEVFKSLGKVEMVAVPYVTENVRVHVIIPVRSSDCDRILTFLKQYSINAMERKDLQFLMLVFIYNAQESSKGEDDIFKEVKNKALLLSNKFEKVGNLIKWHSIKLPANTTDLSVLTQSLLDFAALDSVLRKFSPESLILVGRPTMEVRLDYFNRVRMNTVSGFQVFSPIPFTEYHPEIVYNENRPQPPELDINKNYGHYDSSNFQHIAFYIADYFNARKKIESVIPVVRYDKDIWKLAATAKVMKDVYITDGIYKMLIAHSSTHMLRAVEPSLRLRHAAESCTYCRNAAEVSLHCAQKQANNLATRSQLGRLVLDFQAQPKNMEF